MNELLAKYPAVLDVATVAEILGVTPVTVRRLLKANVIPSVKVGRLTRVTYQSFQGLWTVPGHLFIST